LKKLVQDQTFEHVVQFLAMGASAPVDIDLIVRFVTKQDPDCDENLTAADISKCSLLMKFCPDDSSKVVIKMHQVVHSSLACSVSYRPEPQSKMAANKTSREKDVTTPQSLMSSLEVVNPKHHRLHNPWMW